MKGGCPIPIDETIIIFIVDEKNKKKYKKFSKQQKIKRGRNIMNCPFPDCDELIEIDPKFKKRFYRCENHHNVCSVCKSNKIHNEFECKKVKYFIKI